MPMTSSKLRKKLKRRFQKAKALLLRKKKNTNRRIRVHLKAKNKEELETQAAVSSSLMEAGNAQSVRTITSREEKNAIDAKSQGQLKIFLENPLIWLKLKKIKKLFQRIVVS
jgi:hypothetical protein